MEKKYKLLIDRLFEYVSAINEMLINFTPTKETMGYVFAKSILLRLEATFSALRKIMKYGFSIESLVLVRFIQEQAAYSYEVCKCKKFDELEKVSVTKSITKYKKRIDIIGKFYGELSKIAHIDINSINYYVRVNNNSIIVDKKHSGKLTSIDLFFSFALAVSIYIDSICGMIEEIDNKNITFVEVDRLRTKYNLFIERIRKLNLYKTKFET